MCIEVRARITKGCGVCVCTKLDWNIFFGGGGGLKFGEEGGTGRLP